MAEDYVHHIISTCEVRGISRACSVFNTTGKLLEAYENFVYNHALNFEHVDREIIEALSVAIKKRNIISVDRLTSDAKIIFDRICSELPRIRRCITSNEKFYHDALSDLLTDFNWLVASEYAAGNNQRISLIQNTLQLCSNTRDRLAMVYDQAIEVLNESKYIEEAEKFKWQLLPGLCPYEEVRKYLSQDITYEDRKHWQSDYRRLHFEASLLFFALTAACIKTIDVMRKYHV